MAYTLPNLPYSYSALEPYIDRQTMRIHHDLHHGGYINKLNIALADLPKFNKLPIEDLLNSLSDIPEAARTTITNNAGGHANHSLFWEILTPKPSSPNGEIVDTIKKSFTDFDNFKQKFTEVAMARFGSGWAWLIVKNSKLDIISTANQDSPVSSGATPILGLDVWEHAYYLKYQNKRDEYIKAWWNIVNWQEIERRFQK